MRCYKCKSNNLEFCEGRKGGHIWTKLLLLLITMFFFFTSKYYTILIAGAVVSLFMLIALIIVDKVNYNKTATKVICRRCGRTFWLKRYK